MTNVRVFLVGIVALCLLNAEAARASTIYDAAADFSPTNNPNGVWSYGWSQTLCRFQSERVPLWEASEYQRSGCGTISLITLIRDRAISPVWFAPTPVTVRRLADRDRRRCPIEQPRNLTVKLLAEHDRRLEEAQPGRGGVQVQLISVRSAFEASIDMCVLDSRRSCGWMGRSNDELDTGRAPDPRRTRRGRSRADRGHRPERSWLGLRRSECQAWRQFLRSLMYAHIRIGVHVGIE